MGKMGYEKGLIRYTTQNAIDGNPTRVLRPRILVYALLLTALVGAWAWGIGHRSPLIADVLRDRNALYRVADDGVDNSYTLKLANKSEREARYRVRVESATPGLALRGGVRDVIVPAGEVVATGMDVHAPAGIRGQHALEFVVEASDGSASERVDSTFLGPM